MKRVLLGMSGGVDSSVAAYLLQEKGYEVIGVTMSLFPKENDTSISDAKKVCEKLGIEHHVVDYQDFFQKNIIANFINSYKEGHTPNPCVLCNKKIKFGLLWQKAQELNCDYIATGHYASQKDGQIYRTNSPKDQSYFLYGIDKSVLKHIIFPLAKYIDKSEIRELAENIGITTAHKKDSQDICFIPDGKYANFLEKNLDKLPNKGNFILNGQIIGQHKGIIYYTIGQRKGLGISYERPLYVTSIDVYNNEVILGDEKDLYSNTVYVTDSNFQIDDIPSTCEAKIRYKSQLTSCQIEIIDTNNFKVTFQNPVKSVTPGQSLVLYKDDLLIGGGIITSSR